MSDRARRGGCSGASPAKQWHGLASALPLHAGVLAAVQRFRSDLGLYMHLHCLVTDGVFKDLGEGVRFLAADSPTPARMTAVLAQVHEAVLAARSDDDLDMDPRASACGARGIRGRGRAAARRGRARDRAGSRCRSRITIISSPRPTA